MIEIKYTDTTLSTTGHANYASKGNDIVCAAISAIILGSIKWFKPKDISVKENKKINSITINVKNKTKENKLLLSLIIKQLKPIEKKYKLYVKIRKGK